MPVLVITENFPPKTGGSGRWFWELYRRMPREEVFVVAGEYEDACEFDRPHNLRIERMNLSLQSWGVTGFRQLRDYWRPLKRIRKIVQSERPQAIHCGRCLPEGLLGLALKWATGVPYICYVHGEELRYTNDSRELKWLTRRVIRGAQFLVPNSHNTAQILSREWNVAPANIRVLHPGVDTQVFKPAPKDQSVRNRLGWGNRPVILTVGRLQKRKGHDVMIAALPNIRRSVPNILYAVVGDGEERPALEDLIRREGLEGHVILHGELGDAAIVERYQQCDLFALPNRQVGQDIEGFGIVLLEAQACAKPVLAGTSGGTAETMRIPESGRVVACDEPLALSEAVIDLFTNQQRMANMGEAGRQWVVDHFDWSALVKQASQLFHIFDASAPCETIPSSQSNKFLTPEGCNR